MDITTSILYFTSCLLLYFYYHSSPLMLFHLQSPPGPWQSSHCCRPSYVFFLLAQCFSPHLLPRTVNPFSIYESVSIKNFILSHNYLLSTYYVLDVLLSTDVIAVNQLIPSPHIIYMQVGR